jgi:small subunit ribosomal protein S17
MADEETQNDTGQETPVEPEAQVTDAVESPEPTLEGTPVEEPAPEPDAEPAEAALAEEPLDEAAPAEEHVDEEAPVEAAAEEPSTDEAEPAEAEPAEAAPAEDAVPAEEPVAEEAPVEDAPEEPTAEAPPAEPAPAPAVSQPKKKRRRLARALRHKHSKPTRDSSGERKPIVRTPKPESELGRRQERRGIVVSDKGDKSIVVKVEMTKAHPKYKKVVRRSRRLHAHDEQNSAAIGDVVRIVETRPISKTKNWRLAEIVEKAR